MEANIQLIKKRRFYSKEFKQQLAKENNQILDVLKGHKNTIKFQGTVAANST